MIFKFAFSELKETWKWFLLFILNLTLGLSVFLSLEAFKDSIADRISQNSKNILGADLSISTRRSFTGDELTQIEKVTSGKIKAETHTYEFFGMAATDKSSRLVLVKAIDQNYPLYGDILNISKQKINLGVQADIFKENSAWVYPEVLSQLGISKSDEFRLGNLTLKISEIIGEDSSQTFRGANIAPRVFINQNLLEKSGLIQFGSTYTLSKFYSFINPEDLPEISKQLAANLPDPSIRISSPSDAAENASVQLKYLSDFLGLVSLVALFLSSLGCGYIVRLFITKRGKSIAIYRTLGLTPSESISIYSFVLLLCAVIAVIPSFLFSSLILKALSNLTSELFTVTMNLKLSPISVLIPFLIVMLSSFSIVFPFLLRIKSINLSQLFGEQGFTSNVKITNPLHFLPSLILFALFSIYLSKSIKIGGAFFLTMLGVFILVALFAFYALKLFSLLKLKNSWSMRLSLKSLVRKRADSVSIFVALTICSFLMNLLPQLKTGLQTEFSVQGVQRPSLFMFDIQDHQLAELNSFLGEKKIPRLNSLPIIRGRIEKVNGALFERQVKDGQILTREEERDIRFRNRGVNISYYEGPQNENIIEGRPLTEQLFRPEDKIAEISVVKSYANSLGLKLGDILTFDIQGIEIESKIVNIRTVKWHTFQPNFFIVMQKGVLNDAPKAHLGSLPEMDENQKNYIQLEVVKKFPNISIIDLRRTIDQVLEVSEQMSYSLQFMAIMSFLAGLIILFSVIQNHLETKKWDFNILKIVGAEFSTLTFMNVGEYAALSFISSLFGGLLSVLASYIMTSIFFEGIFSISFNWLILSTLAVTFISTLISFLAIRNILWEKPSVIMQENFR